MPEPAGTPAWRPDVYERNAAFVPGWGDDLLEGVPLPPGARLLDLGCGTGRLARALRERGFRVVGVDAAPAMVAAARAAGVDARLADGAALPFDAEFDGVVSNAALHWMRADPDAVLRGVHRALRPGGWFVGEMGGHGNVAAIHLALREAVRRRGIDPDRADPWFFPGPGEYGRRLADAGFAVVALERFPRPTALPTGLEGWLATFAGPFLDALPATERDGARREVVEALRPILRDADGRWTAPYVRLRFRARRPEAPEARTSPP